jgi:hypothetical protein
MQRTHWSLEKEGLGIISSCEVVLTELHEIARLLAEAEQDLANLDAHRAELLLRIQELKQARNSMSITGNVETIVIVCNLV